MQIYWGAVPFVVIQIIMVGLIIAFPEIVSGGLDQTGPVDISNVQMEAAPAEDMQDAADPMRDMVDPMKDLQQDNKKP
jgi:hypothetical protein